MLFYLYLFLQFLGNKTARIWVENTERWNTNHESATETDARGSRGKTVVILLCISFFCYYIWLFTSSKHQSVKRCLSRPANFLFYYFKLFLYWTILVEIFEHKCFYCLPFIFDKNNPVELVFFYALFSENKFLPFINFREMHTLCCKLTSSLWPIYCCCWFYTSLGILFSS